jgi:hypothetical protein
MFIHTSRMKEKLTKNEENGSRGKKKNNIAEDTECRQKVRSILITFCKTNNNIACTERQNLITELNQGNKRRVLCHFDMVIVEIIFSSQRLTFVDISEGNYFHDHSYIYPHSWVFRSVKWLHRGWTVTVRLPEPQPNRLWKTPSFSDMIIFKNSVVVCLKTLQVTQSMYPQITGWFVNNKYIRLQKVAGIA